MPPEDASQPQGDKVGGDKIIVGDITGTVAAIGAGAQVIYNNVERALSEVELSEQSADLERQRMAEGLRDYVLRLQRRAEQAEQHSAFGSPYKALVEYDIDDAALFYGREQAVNEVLGRLDTDQLTILHSESGGGKSSMLKAAIMPRLLVEGHVPLYVRPYKTTIHYAVKRGLLVQLEQTPNLAIATLHDFMLRATDLLAGQQIIVILDQMEEFFTVQSADQRAEFVAELAGCLDDDLLPVSWIIALRDEWFGQLGTFRPQIRQPYANEYLLRPLNRQEARDVIIHPAEQRGVSYEASLVDKLLNDLGSNEIGPAQLQLVCSGLYDLLNGSLEITNDMYRQAGGVKGILRGHLDRVLSRDLPLEQREGARAVLDALVTSDRRRALRTFDELAVELKMLGLSEEVIREMLGYLVDSRLLKVVEVDVDEAAPDQGVTLAYELAHDYLLDEIELDPVTRTRKAAQELLDREAKNYKNLGTLLSPGELVVIEAERQYLTFSEDATALIEATERQLSRQRLTIFAGAGGALLLIIVAIVSGALTFNFSVLRRQAVLELGAAEIAIAEAEAEAQVAEAEAQVAAAAASDAEVRLEAAADQLALLFEETGTIDVGENPSNLLWVPETSSLWVSSRDANAVQQIDPQSGVILATVPVGTRPAGLAFDGTSIWVANEGDNSIEQININTALVEQTVVVGSAPIDLAWDGRNLWVAHSGENTLGRINVQTGEMVEIVPVDDLPAALLWDEANASLWVASRGTNIVKRYAPDTMELLQAVPVDEGPVAMVLASGGVWIASGGGNSVQRISSDEPSVVSSVAVGDSGGNANPTALTWDGVNLWVSVSDGTLALVDIVDGRQVATINVQRDPRALAWDGSRLWVASARESTVQRVITESGAITATVRVGTSPRALAWDGRNVWVASAGTGTVERIDTSIGSVIRIINVDSFPRSLAWHEATRTLWVANQDGNTVQAISPVSGRVSATIPLEAAPGIIVADDITGSIWVTIGAEGLALEIDAETRTVVSRILIGEQVSGLASDGTNLWASNAGENTVIQIDIATQQIVRSIPVGISPQNVLWDGTRLWVVNGGSDTIGLIDIEAGAMVGTIAVGAGPRDLIWDGSRLWVSNAADNTVQLIDLVTGQVVATIPVGSGPQPLVWDGSTIWVANTDDGTVRRIDPTILESLTDVIDVAQ